MRNYSGYYTGEMSGTNRGGLGLELKHEGNRIYGHGKFSEPTVGGYEYDIQGVTDPKPAFILTPRTSGNFPGHLQLGRVEASVEQISDDGKMEGRWKSSIGTEGAFWIRRQQAPNVEAKLKETKDAVFIVHGHDEGTKEKVARLVERLGLEATILHEKSSKGMTLIGKFEDYASSAGFSIILLTPDDMGYPIGEEDQKRPKARQNVILELGYFVGKIGRSKTSVLFKGDVELPSDMLGLAYIQVDDRDAWKLTLAKELKDAGYEVDLNKLM